MGIKLALNPTLKPSPLCFAVFQPPPQQILRQAPEPKGWGDSSGVNKSAAFVSSWFYAGFHLALIPRQGKAGLLVMGLA